MSCDLVNGRLLNECNIGRAGIKTLYFAKFNDYASLTGITESGGEITDLGADPIIIYQFDLDAAVGGFEEIPVVSKDNGTAFINQVITMTLFNIKPADMAALNALKKGRWVVWTLDFNNKIRLFGQTRGMVATGGSEVSCTAAGDKKGLDLVLESTNNDYSVFMQDYTTTPFDNFANVTTTISGYGPELHTDANAASDPNGNEADATTGWTPLAGATLTSESSVKHTGNYSMLIETNTTPTANGDVDKTFNVDNWATYLVSFYWRHEGNSVAVTGDWICEVEGVEIARVEKTDTTFAPVTHEVTMGDTFLTIRFREMNSANDGGVYFDNLSVRKKLA